MPIYLNVHFVTSSQIVHLTANMCGFGSICIGEYWVVGTQPNSTFNCAVLVQFALVSVTNGDLLY